MKKNFFIIFAAVSFIFGTANAANGMNEGQTDPRESFAQFEELGKIHNAFMQNALDNFVPDDKITNKSDAIDYVLRFNFAYVDKLKLPNAEDVKKYLEDFKYFVDREYFYNKCYTSGKNNTTLFMDIDNALKSKVIDDFEHKKLTEIAQLAKDNLDGKLSNSEMKSSLVQMKEEWIAKGYTERTQYGSVLGSTLGISLASIEWWEANPSASGGYRALNVVGQDVAGAIVGGVVSGVVSYGTTGSVNWKAVGYSAAFGALNASFGVVGKLGKWISNLF